MNVLQGNSLLKKNQKISKMSKREQLTSKSLVYAWVQFTSFVQAVIHKSEQKLCLPGHLVIN